MSSTPGVPVVPAAPFTRVRQGGTNSFFHELSGGFCALVERGDRALRCAAEVESQDLRYGLWGAPAHPATPAVPDAPAERRC